VGAVKLLLKANTLKAISEEMRWVCWLSGEKERGSEEASQEG